MLYTLKPKYRHIVGKTYHFGSKKDLVDFLNNTRQFEFVNTNNKTVAEIDKQLNDYEIVTGGEIIEFYDVYEHESTFYEINCSQNAVSLVQTIMEHYNPVDDGMPILDYIESMLDEISIAYEKIDPVNSSLVSATIEIG